MAITKKQKERIIKKLKTKNYHGALQELLIVYEDLKTLKLEVENILGETFRSLDPDDKSNEMALKLIVRAITGTTLMLTPEEFSFTSLGEPR